MDNNITIKIFTISKGIEVREDIKLIRIKSKKYNLLIMKDYLPIMGEIDGSIDFEGEKDSINYRNIKGYYLHSNDVFNFLIKED